MKPCIMMMHCHDILNEQGTKPSSISHTATQRMIPKLVATALIASPAVYCGPQELKLVMAGLLDIGMSDQTA